MKIIFEKYKDCADIEISVKNHLIDFAAEKARKSGTDESVDEFLKEYGMIND